MVGIITAACSGVAVVLAAWAKVEGAKHEDKLDALETLLQEREDEIEALRKKIAEMRTDIDKYRAEIIRKEALIESLKLRISKGA